MPETDARSAGGATMAGGVKENTALVQYCEELKAKHVYNRNVLLIQIPQMILNSFNPEVARKKGYYAFPPTGLQYLYEAVTDRDLDVRILDMNYMLLKRIAGDAAFRAEDWISILEEYLKGFTPYIIGVSCMFDSGIKPLIQLLEYLKGRGGSIVVTGGVIASYEWKTLLSRELCHFVIQREGENKFNYLMDLLTAEDRHVPPTPGICFNDGGHVLSSEGLPDQVELKGDLINSYSIVEIEDYYRYGSLNPFSRMACKEETPYAAIQMSRGCRGSCSFCSVHDFMGRGIRRRPVEDILREMEFLIKERGVRHFEWLDDDLLFYKQDFTMLLKAVVKREWDITWSANNGLIAKSIDDDLLALMRDSGCIGFKIGIETGNAEMLRKVRKPATLDTFRQVARRLERYPEIFVGGNLIIGLPGERFSQMMDTFRFYLELDLDWAALGICQAIRGSTAFNDFDDYFDAQMKSGGDVIKNFIPSKESSIGHISSGCGAKKGMDVFKIDPQSEPDDEQIREIWFTFNLLVNYVHNKNLRPDGRVKKFITWVEMARQAYPTNPYMSLFLALAYKIGGDEDNAVFYKKKALEDSRSDYWTERFAEFGLDRVMNEFPADAEGAFGSVSDLRRLNAFPGILVKNEKDLF